MSVPVRNSRRIRPEPGWLMLVIVSNPERSLSLSSCGSMTSLSISAADAFSHVVVTEMTTESTSGVI
jgi:hypothetical protein